MKLPTSAALYAAATLPMSWFAFPTEVERIAELNNVLHSLRANARDCYGLSAYSAGRAVIYAGPNAADLLTQQLDRLNLPCGVAWLSARDCGADHRFGAYVTSVAARLALDPTTAQFNAAELLYRGGPNLSRRHFVKAFSMPPLRELKPAILKNVTELKPAAGSVIAQTDVVGFNSGAFLLDELSRVDLTIGLALRLAPSVDKFLANRLPSVLRMLWDERQACQQEFEGYLRLVEALFRNAGFTVIDSSGDGVIAIGDSAEPLQALAWQIVRPEMGFVSRTVSCVLSADQGGSLMSLEKQMNLLRAAPGLTVGVYRHASHIA